MRILTFALIQNTSMNSTTYFIFWDLDSLFYDLQNAKLLLDMSYQIQKENRLHVNKIYKFKLWLSKIEVGFVPFRGTYWVLYLVILTSLEILLLYNIYKIAITAILTMQT